LRVSRHSLPRYPLLQAHNGTSFIPKILPKQQVFYGILSRVAFLRILLPNVTRSKICK
jgi:hypothetical protein